MSDAKTRPTGQAVDQFLDRLTDLQQRQDCEQIGQLMAEVTGAAPQMWGESIVGYGSYHYQYASGREGDWPLIGFSPRKQNLTLYLSYGLEQHADLLEQLGKHKIGKACLYIKRLRDVDPQVLRTLVERSVEQQTRAQAPEEGK